MLKQASALLSFAFITACAGSQPGPAKLAPPPAPPAPPPEPPPASALPVPEWLPDKAVLAARIDLVALSETGPLAALLESWLGEQSGMLEGATRAFVAVEPLAEADRVVLILEADQQPPTQGEAAWTRIARDAWVSCVRACTGYTVVRTSATAPEDPRAPLLIGAAEGELAVAYAAGLLDEGAPAKLALRDRLLDTSVGVASELRNGSLRLMRAGSALAAELHARFTSRGVASSASLLTRGAVFEAADALERAGLTREADLLYALTLTLGEDDMTAKLTVPLDAVPALAVAWLTAQDQGEPETFDEAATPSPFLP